jgi:hypothetical protein
MEKIQVQIEAGKATRGIFARPLVLVTLSAVLITSVLAILFETNQSSIEFGQSSTAVTACGYMGGQNSATLTPSSSYLSGDGTGASFTLTGLNIAFTGTACNGNVLAVTFIDGSGNPINVDGTGVTTIEIDNVTGNNGSALGDLVAGNDVKYCQSDGSGCNVVTSGGISATNSLNSNSGLDVLLGLSSLNIDAGAVAHIVLQTYAGFTS